MMSRDFLRRIVVPVCLLGVAMTPSAAVEEGVVLVREAAASGESTAVLEARVDPTVYDEMLTRSRVRLNGFPLPGRSPVDLELAPYNVLTAGARIVVVDAAGERNVPRPAVRVLRGQVIGDPGGVAILSLFEGRVAGFVRTGEQEYMIAPDSFGADGLAPDEIRVRAREADPDEPDRPFCGGAVAIETGEEPPGPGVGRATALDPDTMLTAGVAIDATYEWYSHFGSLEQAQAYILNLMAQVSTIYEDEVFVQIEVPYLRVFTVAEDPYTDGTTDTSKLLSELRAEWNANQSGVDRTVAHLFSTRPSGGAGIAYINVLCNPSYDYGVSTLSANGGSWEKKLVAHELGHNFSSPHTHCFVPEIDQCANQDGCYNGTVVQTTGTIMSYCSQTTSLFHPRVEDERIRPAAEAAYPACIATAVPTEPPTTPGSLTLY